MMDDIQLGELIGKVNAIKENTDKIPDIMSKSIEHEIRISRMEPLVENHEKTAQRALGVAALMGFIAGVVSSLFKGVSH